MVEYFQKREAWGDIQEAIKRQEKEMPRNMSVEEKGDFINSMIQGHGKKLSLSTSHAKKRVIEVVSSDIEKFYHEPDVA